jgi:fructose-1,6-bisphosphatase-3
VPVDERGEFLSLSVDGRECAGRELFDALEPVVRRAMNAGAETVGDEADWLWYLWTGARSPLFGKDRMSTFENYFVEDKEARRETRILISKLIHEADFCRRVAADFGIAEDALIVNGHVPVKVERGEAPRQGRRQRRHD